VLANSVSWAAAQLMYAECLALSVPRAARTESQLVSTQTLQHRGQKFLRPVPCRPAGLRRYKGKPVGKRRRWSRGLGVAVSAEPGNPSLSQRLAFKNPGTGAGVIHASLGGSCVRGSGPAPGRRDSRWNTFAISPERPAGANESEKKGYANDL